MPLKPEQLSIIQDFLGRTQFDRGMVALDLDGTALLEDRGKVFISGSVEKGVKALHDLKRPVVINTLRFPLSVIRSVGEAWYQIADVPILTVLLNGSVLGYIRRVNQTLEYQELASFPMTGEEIETMVSGIAELFEAGIKDLVLFFYTRNWKAGETIWTPNQERIPVLQNKYTSASSVVSMPLNELKTLLISQEVCMTSLLVDRPEDTLMAYQHSKRNNFFSRTGVDKASGLREIASRLDFSLTDSLGAGDTEMDNFLTEVGLAIIVGNSSLNYRGKIHTLKASDPLELGEMLLQISQIAGSKAAQ